MCSGDQDPSMSKQVNNNANKLFYSSFLGQRDETSKLVPDSHAVFINIYKMRLNGKQPLASIHCKDWGETI